MNESLPTLSALFENQYGSHLPKQGWSKWGGRFHGLDKETLDEWYCQVCGEPQTKVLPSYMFPIDSGKRDFVRICSKCKAKSKIKRVVIFSDLTRIIRRI